MFVKINNLSRLMYRRRVFHVKNKKENKIEADKKQKEELEKVITRKSMKK